MGVGKQIFQFHALAGTKRTKVFHKTRRKTNSKWIEERR